MIAPGCFAYPAIAFGRMSCGEKKGLITQSVIKLIESVGAQLYAMTFTKSVPIANKIYPKLLFIITKSVAMIAREKTRVNCMR